MSTESKFRRNIFLVIVIGVTLVFIGKLFYIQVIDDSYKQFAEMYSIRRLVQFPARGNILDRNGELLVANELSYDLMMIPAEAQPIDTAEFCALADITPQEFIIIQQSVKDRIASHALSKNEGVPVAKELSKEAYAALQEKMYKFKGYYLEQRSIRRYPNPIAAHILGYIGEVDTAVTNHNPYYRPGDYIGISGIEKSYEEQLRGIKGVRKVFVDVHNKEKGPYREGEFDTAAVQGQNLTTTLDLELQAYGELLMQNKKGAIVAIEPATGEILALISAPSYDPNLLVGRGRRKNYPDLLLNENKPLYNRAIMDGYPPGSTFKVLNALVGQEEGVLFPSTMYPCAGGYRLTATKKVGCHGHPTPDLRLSLKTSCNAYYCSVFNSVVSKYPTAREGYVKWRNWAMKFGFGTNLDTDIPNVKKGNIPDPEYYDKLYPWGWRGATVISLGIGQGELQANALQIANLACAVANRGSYVTPHVGKEIGNEVLKFEKHDLGIDKKYFDLVVDALYGAVNEPGGTGWIARMDTIAICGKTGTAQNPHGKDHSVFMAFAPRDNPKIAIGVLVENAGFGATWAAPIASLMIEKYIFRKITRLLEEKRIVEGNLMSDK